jgi:signal transduction histidine kinase
VCETIDQTPIMKVYRRKDELAENLGSSLRNHLAAVEFAAALLASEDQQLKRDGYQKMIHQKVTQAAASLAETQHLVKEVTYDAEDSKPIEPHYALVAAVKAVEPSADARGVTVAVNRSDIPSHVYADFNRLQRAFESLLSLLLSDARDNTKIEVDVEERVDEVFFTLKNSGYGIPTEQLREYLACDNDSDGDSNGDSNEHRPLREAIRWVNSCGGLLTATSKVNVGTTVHFRLQRFC